MRAKSTSIFLLCQLLITLSINLQSQAPFRKFGVKNYGNSIAEPFHTGTRFSQDSLGRLLTANYIYDGDRFVKDPTQNANGVLKAIDKKGGKWYKNDHFEISYIYGQKMINLNTEAYFKYDVNSVYLHEDEVYLVTNLGAVQYQQTEDSLLFVRAIPVPSEEIWSMHKIKDTLFFKTLEQSMYLLESNLEKVHIYGKQDLSNHDNGVFFLPNDRIILKSIDYEILLTTEHPHYKLLSTINDNTHIQHFVDSKKRLWLSLRGEGKMGVYLAEADSDQLEYIDLNIEPTSFFYNIYEDTHGSIWISTVGQGIVQLYEQGIQNLGKNFGLSSDNIWSISQNKHGQIYFSTGCSGIDILEPDGELSHIFGTSCQSAIFHDSKNNLWSSTNGLTKVTPNGRIENYTKEDGLISRTVRVLFEDSEQVIWIGTRKAIHKFDGQKFEAFVVDGVEEFDRVLALQEYADGNFILAFGSGKIFTFDGQNFSTVDFNKRKVNTIFKDQEGRILIASERDGLFQFKNKVISPIPNSDQNLPQGVKMLQDDRLGNLWGICENNSIFSVKKNELFKENNTANINYYTIENGVPLMASNNDVQPTTKLFADGRIIFPNIYGAILIDPIKINRAIPEFHTIVLSGDTLIKEQIALSYGQNDISLKIKPIVLSVNKSFPVQYKYQGNWLEATKEGLITMNNLPNGNNRIDFRIGVAQDQWRSVPSIVVFVPSLIYQRWYFQVGCALLLAGLFYLFVRWRTNIVKERNKVLKEKVKQQTKALEIEKLQLSESLATQKKLTQELNLSQAAKNRMYAQISHEFKSPLQAIKANLNNGDGTLIVANNKRIAANINNLLDISNEIMELSKAESGNLKAKMNWYNINGIIKDQIEFKRPLAEEKNIELSFLYDTKKFFLHIDISLIQKVLNNLLSNAIKFSPKDAVIRIESISADRHQLIRVTDSGTGIPKEDISKLTLPYFQASNNIESGTGIGLSLTEQLLKLHDSKLEIESTLQQGSTFAFRLHKPKIAQEAILKEFINLTDIDQQIEAIINVDKPIVLAVDDSQDVLFFIDQALNTDYYIVKANNGAAALKVLDKIEPNLIISDVNMPVMNGMELLKAVREFQQFKATPFLFLSGSLSEDTELKSIKAGADFVLQKPIEEEYLVSRIKQMFARQENLEEKVKSSFAHDLLPQNIHNDDLFLMKALEKVILESISQPKLKSADIANHLGIGEKTLRNRVKGIAGLTLKEYLRSIRLEKAKLLIEENYGNLGEIAIATGFSSLSYFSKSYKAYFEEKGKD